MTLLLEEMRRVIQYLTWHENWWTDKAEQGWEMDLVVLEGLSAYALRQAGLRKSIRNHFEQLWRDVPTWVSMEKVSSQEEGED